jgi:hypothetical protein
MNTFMLGSPLRLPAWYYCLILGQQLRILDGTVVVHLSPAAVDFPEQTAGAYGGFEVFVARAQITTFPAHRVEQLPGLVQGVIVVLDVDLGRTFEESRVHGLYLAPSPRDAAQRVVHGNVGGAGPVLRHHRHVACIEGTIKLAERLLRRRQICRVLLAIDRFLNRLHVVAPGAA